MSGLSYPDFSESTSCFSCGVQRYGNCREVRSLKLEEWENWRVLEDCFKLFQTNSNFFKQLQTFRTSSNYCQTSSNYNCEVQFFLNFLSASALRPDLSGNPFFRSWKSFGKKKIGNGRRKFGAQKKLTLYHVKKLTHFLIFVS